LSYPRPVPCLLAYGPLCLFLPLLSSLFSDLSSRAVFDLARGASWLLSNQGHSTDLPRNGGSFLFFVRLSVCLSASQLVPPSPLTPSPTETIASSGTIVSLALVSAHACLHRKPTHCAPRHARSRLPRPALVLPFRACLFVCPT